LREEAINGLVGVHVTVLKSSIDLLLGAVMHNLLQALHHLPRRRWDCRYPITSLPTTASSSPTHSLPPSLSLSLYGRLRSGKAGRVRHSLGFPFADGKKKKSKETKISNKAFSISPALALALHRKPFLALNSLPAYLSCFSLSLSLSLCAIFFFLFFWVF